MNTEPPEERIDILTYLQNSAPAKVQTIPHSLRTARSHWQRTEVYTSHGCRYVRYRWGKGSESWGYLHISGGAANTELVHSRKSHIDQLIMGGASLDEIKRTIAGWENAKAGRKKGNAE